MADSQCMCLRDDHVNNKITENLPEFYYSENQRKSLEILINKGVQTYRQYIKENKLSDFLSSKELTDLKSDFKKYETESSSKSNPPAKQDKEKGVSLQYWPTLSDTEVPPLDLGWPENGFYRGLSQVLVYTHPPKEKAPTIKTFVRSLIQSAKKVSYELFFNKNCQFPKIDHIIALTVYTLSCGFIMWVC